MKTDSPTADTVDITEKTEELILDSKAQLEVDELESSSLADLAMGVETLENSIALAKSKVDDVLNEKLANVCRQGIYLIAAKARLGHTKFMNWLNGCKDAPSLRTAERRMSLGAKSAHVSNLPPGTTISQAYIKLGITKRPASLGPAGELRRDLRAIKRKLRTLSGRIPLADRPRIAKEIRGAERSFDKAALRMETAVLQARLLEEELWHWTCLCFLLPS